MTIEYKVLTFLSQNYALICIGNITVHRQSKPTLIGKRFAHVKLSQLFMQVQNPIS